MTSESSTTGSVWVAIDIAKAFHHVLIEFARGTATRRAYRQYNGGRGAIGHTHICMA
jgi:hypothetical protein